MPKNKNEHNDDYEAILKEIANPSFDLQRLKPSVLPYQSEIIIDVNRFYRRIAKYFAYSLISSAAVFLILVLAIFKLAMREPITLGYIESQGRVIQLEPIEIPSMNDGQVLTWAGKQALNIHKLSFFDAKEHVDSFAPFFSKEAYENYQRALVISDVWSVITNKENKQVSWAELTTAPRIINEGLENGAWTWVIRLELTIFIGGGERSTYGTPVIATMRVKRTSRQNSDYGVVIDGYAVKEAE